MTWLKWLSVEKFLDSLSFWETFYSWRTRWIYQPLAPTVPRRCVGFRIWNGLNAHELRCSVMISWFSSRFQWHCIPGQNSTIHCFELLWIIQRGHPFFCFSNETQYITTRFVCGLLLEVQRQTGSNATNLDLSSHCLFWLLARNNRRGECFCTPHRVPTLFFKIICSPSFRNV